ncbi:MULTISPECIES: aldose 1-epimerase [unclassified Polaribacter]|uniref:aldose 1-epimerase n=1 Tax=unclassified Polaribacter TaxID=196858 RepID=UPI0011BE3CEF|nr:MULTISPECIES: aldose 1-epimerase [unclassified Polaribacter]TXD52778.1 aldose 1-epimerase [Polaribacter sp. IC063]TXD61655.1 aldose 1-epimerase [Polaribacter sp. IC066]
MKNVVLLISEDKQSEVKIENGELISFKKENQEYIHQKGSKGWRKSDDEMFPIIGPTDKNNFKVHTKNGDAVQDQHGMLREMVYTLVSSDKKSANFIKKYQKNTQITNSKFPEKSTEANLFWPFDFSFEKNFKLDNDILTINFIINSEKRMPFMLGYHPAFLLSETGKETLVSGDKGFTLDEIYKAGANAFPVLNTDKIILKNSDKKDLEITTKGFNNFMLWTEVDNMICIEPITQYTSYTDQKFSEENMSLSEEKNSFSVKIKVL